MKTSAFFFGAKESRHTGLTVAVTGCDKTTSRPSLIASIMTRQCLQTMQQRKGKANEREGVERRGACTLFI